MKVMIIGVFLSLSVSIALTSCVENNTGTLGETTKQAEPIVEEPAVIPKRFEKVTASRLNLREGATTKSKIMAVLEKNETVEVLTEKEGWVEVISESGRQGWVASAYLTGFAVQEAEGKKVAASAKAEPVISQEQQDVAPPLEEKPTSEQILRSADTADETDTSVNQGELNILGIIPGMDFQEACAIAEQLYERHKPFFDKAHEDGFYDKRVFREVEDPYGYYDAWCGIFSQTGDKIEIDERGGLLLKKQYGKLVYMAIHPDVIDQLFNATDMDAAAFVAILEQKYHVTPWEQVDMIDSQTKKVAYSLYQCQIGPTGEHLSITIRPEKFLEMDDFRVEAAAAKAAPQVISVQLTNPGDQLEQELVDIANDFRRALEEDDLEAFDRHNPTGEKTPPEEFAEIKGFILLMLPDFTNAKGMKFEHDEKDALLVYRTNLENEKEITLASMRFSKFDDSWKIAGGMLSTSFPSVNEIEDEKAIVEKLAEEPKFQFQVPEVAMEQEEPPVDLDVEVKEGTYGSFIENGVEMEIKGVVPLWNSERKELTFTLWPFTPTREEIELIQWGISSNFWKTGRPEPEPEQWPGGWPFGKYTVSWSMDEDSIGDHGKAWMHVYTYGISEQNNNINLNSNQYNGKLQGVIKEGSEIELVAKGEDDLSGTTLAWTISYKGKVLPALSKETMPPSGNYTVFEGLGDKYTGDWLDGKKHGQGTFMGRDGDHYSGGWKDGKKHGQGEYTWSDGKIYKGDWQDDNPYGQGVLITTSGDTYDGQWKEGRPHGQLTFTSPSGVKYDGEWQSGLQHGSGTSIDSSGRKYVGTWKDGKKDGQFEFTDSGGEVQTQTYKSGQLVQQAKTVDLTGQDLGSPGSGQKNFGAMPASQKAKQTETSKGKITGAIVSEDWKDTGDNLITTDTASGLQWLDVTVTLRKSWDELSGQLGPGGAFEGWEYASGEQLNTLIKNATGKTIEEGKTQGWSGVSEQNLEKLMNLLGVTYDFGPHIQSAGILEDGEHPFHDLGVILFYRHGHRPTEVYIEEEGLQDFFASESSGSFLIRKK